MVKNNDSPSTSQKVRIRSKAISLISLLISVSRSKAISLISLLISVSLSKAISLIPLLISVCTLFNNPGGYTAGSSPEKSPHMNLDIRININIFDKD